MIKPKKLVKGDKVAIISLSSGLLGEPYMTYQRDLIFKRLNEFGLEVVLTPNSLKGREFIEKNPQARAEDLKWAFRDDSIKGIICAIGGIDTYKTVPFLLDDESFINNVKNNPKVFIGYSDTTSNHLMFHRIGLTTYYDEYKKIYTDIIRKYNTPVLFNMNFGHAHPKCILPYGVEATIDCDNKRVIINESLVN